MIYMGLTSWSDIISKNTIDAACNDIKNGPASDLALAGQKCREIASDLDNDKVLYLIIKGKRQDYAGEIDQLGQALLQAQEKLDSLIEQIKRETNTRYNKDVSELNYYNSTTTPPATHGGGGGKFGSSGSTHVGSSGRTHGGGGGKFGSDTDRPTRNIAGGKF